MSQDDGDSRTCNRRCGSGHVVPDLGWHTRELAVGIRAGALAGLMVVVASLSGCIAPDVEVIGALGVTVDEEQPGRRGGGVSPVARSLALNPCR